MKDLINSIPTEESTLQMTRMPNGEYNIKYKAANTHTIFAKTLEGGLNDLIKVLNRT